MENLSTEFDGDFAKLNLKWLPWIGKDYSSLPTENRLLLIGESHYAWFDEDETLEDVLEIGNDKTYTRTFINNQGLFFESHYKGEINNKFVRNIERAIFCKRDVNDEQRKKMWTSVAFFNLVQRLLVSIDERPNENDFIEGWMQFIEIIEIIKPSHCILCGIQASSRIVYAIELLNQIYGFEKIKWETETFEQIGSSFARTIKIITQSNFSTSIYVIKHPSKYFSWEKWGNFIRTQNPEYSKWLSK